jgi:hypothetical protein
MIKDLRETAVRRYDEIADELERAVRHLRTTAHRFRDHDVRAGARMRSLPKEISRRRRAR